MKTILILLFLACNGYAKDIETLHPGMYTVSEKYALLEATEKLFLRLEVREGTKMAIVKTNTMIRSAYPGNPPIVVTAEYSTDSVLFIVPGLGIFKLGRGGYNGGGGRRRDKFFNYNGDPPPAWLFALFALLVGLLFRLIAFYWNWQIATGLCMFVLVGIYIIARIITRL